MYEVEIKVRVKNIKDTHDLLQKLSPTLVEEVSYYDTYFDNELREFTNEEKELRVREITNGKKKVILTFKDNPFDKSTKSKPEFEVSLDNRNAAVEIFTRLGYVVDITLIKKCMNYYFEFEKKHVLGTMVRIQELESTFLELEIMVERVEKIEEAKNTLNLILSYLNISKSDITSEYYTDLVRNARKS